MIVTCLELLDKSKVKIYINEEYAFLLYQKDIQRFQIEEGMEITEELYHDIIENTIYRRAKQKAIAILKYMDRTEEELRNKLKGASYPNEIIDRTIQYVKEYDYLNDERFASFYVRNKMKTKSKLQIRLALLQKGIRKEIIDNIFTKEYEDKEQENPEDIAIKKHISKKTRGNSVLTQEEKQKLMTSLYRKGFDIERIKKHL